MITADCTKQVPPFKAGFLSTAHSERGRVRELRGDFSRELIKSLAPSGQRRVRVADREPEALFRRHLCTVFEFEGQRYEASSRRNC